jgi:hypothetical protein
MNEKGCAMKSLSGKDVRKIGNKTARNFKLAFLPSAQRSSFYTLVIYNE